jgi:hypothetical protein
VLLALCRAAALVGALAIAWSLNLRWGGADVGVGPPMQWERHVVGAALLAGIALVAMLFAGRGRRPPLAGRALALAAALGAVAIAAWMRRDAARGFPHLVEGAGWTSVAIGAGLAALGALGYLALVREAGSPPSARRRR